MITLCDLIVPAEGLYHHSLPSIVNKYYPSNSHESLDIASENRSAKVQRMEKLEFILAK